METQELRDGPPDGAPEPETEPETEDDILAITRARSLHSRVCPFRHSGHLPFRILVGIYWLCLIPILIYSGFNNEWKRAYYYIPGGMGWTILIFVLYHALIIADLMGQPLRPLVRTSQATLENYLLRNEQIGAHEEFEYEHSDVLYRDVEYFNLKFMVEDKGGSQYQVNHAYSGDPYGAQVNPGLTVPVYYEIQGTSIHFRFPPRSVTRYAGMMVATLCLLLLVLLTNCLVMACTPKNWSFWQYRPLSSSLCLTAFTVLMMLMHLKYFGSFAEQTCFTPVEKGIDIGLLTQTLKEVLGDTCNVPVAVVTSIVLPFLVEESWKATENV